ncbi:bacteriocin [Pseudomonas sp. SWI6]|uniref:Bacteriocin n=4 Tax=Pseudomonas TaxID=286 RepID=A0ABR6VCN0_9PSED|nr:MULTISPECIES: polymorphic toxin type 44 domain-containing protein [Pseudomonas]AVD81463.1 bacteriocin [Pseudomonas sp. SWI6]QQZ35705.1 bacteriocin [Pseudomonas sp. SK2]AVD88418.1 bacteriocin [Pseudomonas sp. SWI44]MBC3478227.1 bacteriocin [Pseudomonas taiwanensis]MBC3493040.1 bacteriocin [Pseudomonas taiwanensis]
MYPPTASVDSDMNAASKARNYFKNGGSAFLVPWFYSMVRNRGEWDYKQQGRQYEAFGNFNYGATGTAAGLSQEFLLRGAGWAQRRAGTCNSAFGSWCNDAPYGDAPEDQAWIKAGIEYAKSRGYSVPDSSLASTCRRTRHMDAQHRLKARTEQGCCV